MTEPGPLCRPRWPAAAAVLSLCAAIAAPASAPARADENPVLVQSGPLSFAPLVRRVVPAVVNIAVTEEVDDAAADAKVKVPAALRDTPFEKQFRDRMRTHREQMLGAGSGFVIDPSGVIGKADKIIVALSDGTELPAKVLGSDELTDIAVIQVKTDRKLAYVTWGRSQDVQIGDWVLAAGNPFGLGSSVTAGIVSARGRDIGAGLFDDFLQLDAPINPGNSGGPSFNMRGEVVALNTAFVSPGGGSVGIGFSIPSELVEPIVEQLRAKGHIDRGWLGVTLENAAGGGVTIVSVDKGGPGQRAGLHPGDVVQTVNGEHVESNRGLIRTVAAAAPGSSIRLALSRHGKPVDVLVVVGRRTEGPS